MYFILLLGGIQIGAHLIYVMLLSRCVQLPTNTSSINSSLPTQSYRDYPSPRKNDYQHLSRVLGTVKYTSTIDALLMDRNEGEYRISPIDVNTFDKWAEEHS
jgi:hypothetical protein